jgi:peptidoglycan/LPS O-acetylase OafA/YrhL
VTRGSPKVSFSQRNQRKDRTVPSPAPTFDQIMRAEQGHPTGFDYLRLGLALSVLSMHVVYISDHPLWRLLWTTWFAPFELVILPAFFVVSGFLVTGSLFRNSIPQFLALRALRIVPALAVVVIFSALVLGALVTTLPIGAYLKSGMFHAYFLNIVGDIHYQLPGVFGGRTINTQLWTIPVESECYMFLVVLSLAGLVRRTALFAGILLAATVAMTVLAVHHSWYQANWNVPGRMLVLSFMCGVAAFLLKSRIAHTRSLFLACALATYVFLGIPDLVFLAAAPLAYITVYIGLLRLRPIQFGDLSYGVYLFHFPIARSLYELTGRQLTWELMLPLTVILSMACAALSWNLVEQPSLHQKRRVLPWIAAATNRVVRLRLDGANRRDAAPDKAADPDPQNV